MRVAYYLPDFGGGGAEAVVTQAASAVRARGHDVVLVVDRDEGPCRRHVVAGVPIVSLPRGSVFRRALALRQELEGWGAEILVSNLPICNTVALLSRLAGLSIPTVQVLHGGLRATSGIIGRVSFLVLALTSRLLERTVVVSAGLAKEIGRLGVPANKVAVIRNGVALTGLHADCDGRGYILSVGRLVPEKGHETLIRAFALIRDRYAGNLVILGEGQMRPRLEGLVRSLGLEARVSLPGYCVDIARHYEGADLFVLPSREEAFGLVIVEALSYGLGIVATTCAGPTEILQGETYGRLAAPEDQDSLGAAMLAVLTEPPDRARQRARSEEFSLNQMCADYEALFSLLVGRQQTATAAA